MEFTEAFEELVASDSFKEWQKQNPGFYLVHFFAELDSLLRPLNWEIGYYSSERDVITTFAVNQNIRIQPEAQAFKEQDTIELLDVAGVKISSSDALYAARELQRVEYVSHPPLRGIIVLQHLKDGTIWNVTFITQSFAALNIKVDVADGHIVSHHLTTFFDLRA